MIVDHSRRDYSEASILNGELSVYYVHTGTGTGVELRRKEEQKKAKAIAAFYYGHNSYLTMLY